VGPTGASSGVCLVTISAFPVRVDVPKFLVSNVKPTGMRKAIPILIAALLMTTTLAGCFGDTGDSETQDTGDSETQDTGDSETQDTGDSETQDTGDSETLDSRCQDAIDDIENGTWVRDHDEERNLKGCDFSGMDLSGLDFNLANFEGATLSGADLSYADLTAADLNNANLEDSFIAFCIDAAAPSPSSGGEVMWYASPLMPKPTSSA